MIYCKNVIHMYEIFTRSQCLAKRKINSTSIYIYLSSWFKLDLTYFYMYLIFLLINTHLNDWERKVNEFLIRSDDNVELFKLSLIYILLLFKHLISLNYILLNFQAYV